MSGFELLPFVRQQFPSTRVVAMSGEYSGYDVPAGIVADAFYAKASNIRDLLKIVETMVYLDARCIRDAQSQVSELNLRCVSPCSALTSGDRDRKSVV